VSFERFSEKLQLSYTTLSILAQIDFMRPMPLWTSNAVEEGGPSAILEKVDYVPNGAGVLIRNGVGFTLHWIQKNVYYMLTVNHLPGAEPKEIASRIKQIT